MEGRRVSRRLQEKREALQMVVTTTSQPTHERRLFGRACEWTREQMNMLRCRFRQNAVFHWDVLWNKAGTMPPELQKRTPSIHSVSLTYLGIEEGVGELRAIEIDNLLEDLDWEDQLFEKAVHFDGTFHSLLELARKKKDSKASSKIRSSRSPTTSLKRSSNVVLGSLLNKRAKSTHSLSSSLNVGSCSQPDMGASPESQDSTTSTDEDSTSYLLHNFVTECLRFLRSPFTEPAWSQRQVKLDVGYNPVIMFTLTSHSSHDTRFRLGVEFIRVKDDGGIHLVTMSGKQEHWRPNERNKVLPIMSLEAYPLHLRQSNT